MKDKIIYLILKIFLKLLKIKTTKNNIKPLLERVIKIENKTTTVTINNFDRLRW
jgi:hypothetical protein